MDLTLISLKTIKTDSETVKFYPKTIKFCRKRFQSVQNNNPGARQRPGDAAGGGAFVISRKFLEVIPWLLGSLA